MSIIAIITNAPLINSHISLYYQTITLLNTKSNILVLYVIFVLIVLNHSYISNYSCLTIILMLSIYNMFAASDTHFFINLSFYSNGLNTSLINGIVLIHPIFLYTFYGLFFTKIRYHFNMANEHIIKRYSRHHMLVSLSLNSWSLLLIITSIVLGCWWAEQELSWGGWWSWDFVELVALNFFVMFLVKIHSLKSDTLQVNKATYFLKIVVVSIMVVRFNIVNSIHNFINLESQNQYMYYIITLIVIMIVLILFTPSCTTNAKKTIITATMFRAFYLFFFILFFINITALDAPYICSSIIKNIRYIYLYILVTAIIANTAYINIYKPWVLLLVVCITSFFKLSFVDYTIILFINFYVIIIKTTDNTGSNNAASIITLIHLCVLACLFAIIYQTFLFYSSLDFTVSYSNICIKANSFFKVFSLTIATSFTCNDNYHFLTNKIDIDIFHSKVDNDIVTSGFFKNIFEKATTMSFFFLDETYNYNLQTLIQTNTPLFILFLIILLCSFLLAFVKYSDKAPAF